MSREHRAGVDAALAGRLGGLGNRAVEAAARAAAYRVEPHGFLARVAAAEADRRVSVRPAPEAMARLSALLPAAQA
ncbi:MAG: HNH endonuclease, partial [Actinomycetota bacterium]|nr:HNH endonuclease [Actinomycetota bacterium]